MDRQHVRGEGGNVLLEESSLRGGIYRVLLGR